MVQAATLHPGIVDAFSRQGLTDDQIRRFLGGNLILILAAMK